MLEAIKIIITKQKILKCMYIPVLQRDSLATGDVFKELRFIPRLVAFLAGDRGMGDCVDLSQVVGSYYNVSTERCHTFNQ